MTRERYLMCDPHRESFGTGRPLPAQAIDATARMCGMRLTAAAACSWVARACSGLPGEVYTRWHESGAVMLVWRPNGMQTYPVHVWRAIRGVPVASRKGAA